MAKGRISVPISEVDRAALQRWSAKLQGMKEAPLTCMLLHYGIRHAPEAIKEMMEEQDEPEDA